MSRGSRWVIGALALLTGCVVLPTGLALGSELPVLCRRGVSILATLPTGLALGSELPGRGVPVVGVGGVVLVTAVACLAPSSWPVTLRIIGVSVFLAFAAYLVASIGTPNVIRAIGGFVVIGLPFGVLGISGSYPRWGRGAAAVQREQLDLTNGADDEHPRE